MNRTADEASLLVTAGERTYALPLSAVIETLRPLPAEGFAGMPPFVLGMSVLRGAAVPVLDLAALQEGRPARPGRRVVSLHGGVALSVDDVLGVATLRPEQLSPAPLLADGEPAGWVRALGHLEGRLLVVIEPAGLPEPGA